MLYGVPIQQLEAKPTPKLKRWPAATLEWFDENGCAHTPATDAYDTY